MTPPTEIFRRTEQKRSLADVAYDKILNDIIEGRFAVNSKLPSEPNLSLEMGLSRPILRVALTRLKQDGVLAAKKGSGNYIIRQPHRTVLSLADLSQISDIQDCFRFRVGIEGEGAYHAASQGTVESLQLIDKALAVLSSVVRDRQVGAEADFEFHLRIAQASRNPYFISSLQAIRSHAIFAIEVSRQLSLQRSVERMLQVQAEHEAIRDAIFSGEPEIARDAMRTHIENARQRIFEGDMRELASFDPA